MGWDFVTSLADVHLDDTLGVDRETLVRVDGHAEETRVGLLDSTSFRETTGQIRHAINRNQTKKKRKRFSSVSPRQQQQQSK